MQITQITHTVRLWWHRLGREQVQSFFRFLWNRFLDDRCFETAGALSYTTLFALVPLSMVVFGILSAFPVFEEWSGMLTNFVFSNFVPSSARVVESHLRDFAQSARQLTATGVVALLVSLLLTMWSIESTFNRVWRVPTPRSGLLRFLIYWTLLTLGTLGAVASLAVTSYLFSLPVWSGEATTWGTRLLGYQPEAARKQALVAFMAQNGDPNTYVITDTNTWQGSDLKRHYNHERLRSLVALILMTPEFMSR